MHNGGNMDYKLYLHWTRLLPPNRLQRAALHKTLLLPLIELDCIYEV